LSIFELGKNVETDLTVDTYVTS